MLALQAYWGGIVTSSSTGWLCSGSLPGPVPTALVSWDLLSTVLPDWGPGPQALQKPCPLKFRCRQPCYHGSAGQSPCHSSVQAPQPWGTDQGHPGPLNWTGGPILWSYSAPSARPLGSGPLMGMAALVISESRGNHSSIVLEKSSFCWWLIHTNLIKLRLGHTLQCSHFLQHG